MINRSTSARTSKIIYFLHCGPVGLWIISIKRRSIILSDTRGSLAKRTLPLIIIDHARTPTSYPAFEPHHRPHPISRIPSCVSLCWLCGKCHWDNWKLIMLTYLESDCWDGDSLMMPEPYNFHTPLSRTRTVADNQPGGHWIARGLWQISQPHCHNEPTITITTIRSPVSSTPNRLDACQVAIHLVTARQALSLNPAGPWMSVILYIFFSLFPRRTAQSIWL